MTKTIEGVSNQKTYETFTAEEVSRIFKISPRTVRNLIRRGELPAIRLGQIYRIPESVIEQYFDLPALSHLPPEELGFGLWEDDDVVADAVKYVNEIRAANKRTLREVIEELASWQE